MDAVVKSLLERQQSKPASTPLSRPTREEAEAAVRTLLLWAGDDPDREGLRDTPRRVVKAYQEFFSGYREDASSILARVFEEVHGYDDLVLVRDIPFSSHCEHHMVPFIGKVHIGYYPGEDGVVGLSEARPSGRDFCAAFANARGTDGASHRSDRPAFAAARLRRHGRSRAHVHFDARRSKAGRGDRDTYVYRRFQGRSCRTGPLSHPRPQRVVTPVPLHRGADAAAEQGLQVIRHEFSPSRPPARNTISRKAHASRRALAATG